ncbi:4-hydroxythreonine-4-phosphate dehydrogenase [uncultured Desulfatiglans sp.]|uniref:4-hydroxythreonine-4-phosphate dehydrogenase n=1 Tax=Uncultured Desulfatiglans sp. TaxID=1748965 RepID=A0A653AFZ8_UNCDX|nr:4-hydroxythreonine-4-phosphate dehydrogenase [uncultured Desulfatiglans sp.]
MAKTPFSPLIGITMGDPAGVGPEVIAKALADPDVYRGCRPFVLGDAGVMREALPPGMAVRTIEAPADAGALAGRVDLLPLSHLPPSSRVPGRPTVEGGRAMVGYILEAVELARKGRIDAMVTAPINKALMHAAGFPYQGHTQLIAERTGARDYVMMLAGERLRVTLVTIHCALKEVPGLLDASAIHRTISVTHRALRRDFGIERPRIAVAALNPHAGEEGLFGDEEARVIAPAVQAARAEGMEVAGPLPADTLFFHAAAGRYDVVVCMYHDQGLIPLKLLHFADGVNVTLGLPIVRTSVDHGTAYDIAGKGHADPSSLMAALRMAASMARHRAAAGEAAAIGRDP